MSKLNNITGNYYSDEWYTDLNTVNLVVDLLQPKGIICCPFDSDKSLFTRRAKELGNCIYGMTDWLDRDYEYDFLMTNPPFSIKDYVIEKVLASKKPSALILPLDSIGGVKRHNLFEKYGYPTVYIPTKRISYFDETWKKKNGSNFHSVIMLLNTGKQEIIWEQRRNNADTTR